MEIGKKTLTESDFSALCISLEKELYSLATQFTCNAITIYNIIYEICTSKPSYNTALYWKIGDFFYQRCKNYQLKLTSSKDYIREYAKYFLEYKTFIEHVDNLGIILNDCVLGHRLKDFGYMFWDRGVIQKASKTFFKDVYHYNSGQDSDSIRIQVIKSFREIHPSPSNELLYYKEMYESVALKELKKAYASIKTDENICNYSKLVISIVYKEQKRFISHFLPESHPIFEETIGNILFPDRELICSEICSVFWKAIPQTKITGILQPKTRGCQKILFSPEFEYKSTSLFPDIYETTKNICKTENSGISQIDIGRFKPSENLKYCLKENTQILPNIDTVLSSFLKNSRNSWIKPTKTPQSLIEFLVCNLGSFSLGYNLVKKGYATFILEYLNRFQFILSGNIRSLYAHYKILDISYGIAKNLSFPENEFQKILIYILRYALERTKPCFIDRICNFINDGLINPTLDHPFQEDKDIFCSLIPLVSDINEFNSIYISMLKERLIYRSSDINMELNIINSFEQDRKQKLNRIIEEANSVSKDKIRVYTKDTCQGVEDKYPSIALPEQMKQFIQMLHPNSKIEGTSIRLDSKIIDLSNKYSRINLKYGNLHLKTDILQYIVLHHIDKYSTINKSVGIPDTVLRKILKPLFDNKIVFGSNSFCRINPSLNATIDLVSLSLKANASLIDEDEISIKNYIISIGAKIIKRKKHVLEKEFIKELLAISRIPLNEIQIIKGIGSLVEKSILERCGSYLDYII